MEGFTQRQTIELTQSNPVLVRDQPIVKGDVQALVWIVTIKKNGVPVDLAGATASLYCARALSEDGSSGTAYSEAPTESGGTIYSEAPTESGGTTYSEATIESGGTVKAVLPRDAANIPGPVGCMIRVTRDGASVAVARMAVMAVDLTGDDILDEGKRIPSLDEITASIARCDAAAEKAEGAAASVGYALKQVASAIEAANGAASDARNAAGQATDGASAAKAAATTATEAATKIDDMTITATGLAAGAAPTAALTEVDGHYNIVLGLPKGDKGDPGATPQITVQVKTGEPGTAASVKQTGTAEAPVIELTIPRGDTGSLGTLTINGKAPDAAGKVELTAADVGALSGTDATLTQEGKAADAKAAGDELNQLKTDIDPLLYDNAGAHNAIYRGKNLGASVTAAQWASIKAGTFGDLYIGDYWTIGGVTYRIAAFDYYLRAGDTDMTTHHVTLVPDASMYSHVMNDTNVTTGGYVGSKMYTTGLADAKTTINNAFGSTHILTHRRCLCNAVSGGKPSGVSWYDSTVELMTELNVYGSKVFGVCNTGSAVPILYTVDKSQYPLFAFRPDLISNRASFWLRDVSSSSTFAYVSNNGRAAYLNASETGGVRPAFSIIG